MTPLRSLRAGPILGGWVGWVVLLCAGCTTEPTGNPAPTDPTGAVAPQEDEASGRGEGESDGLDERADASERRVSRGAEASDDRAQIDIDEGSGSALGPDALLQDRFHVPSPSMTHRSPPSPHVEFRIASPPLGMDGVEDEDAGVDESPPVPRPGAPTSFADLVEEVRPAVITILSSSSTEEGSGDEQGARSRRMARGTGFLIDDSGVVMTNRHVISGNGGERMEIACHGGDVTTGRALLHDTLRDVALLQIEPCEGMRPLRVSRGDDVRVGDWVLSIASPLGLHSSVTAGIVSAMGRRDNSVDGEGQLMQTDMSVNPGSSGGPVVNMAGEVVAMLVATSIEGQGLGFAIPMHLMSPLVDALEREGGFRPGRLGVRIRATPDVRLEAMGDELPPGLLITEIFEGEAAEAAGVELHDVLVRLGGVDIHGTERMRWLVQTFGAGAEVELELWRDGRVITTAVTLDGLREEGDEDSGQP